MQKKKNNKWLQLSGTALKVSGIILLMQTFGPYVYKGILTTLVAKKIVTSIRNEKIQNVCLLTDFSKKETNKMVFTSFDFSKKG